MILAVAADQNIIALQAEQLVPTIAAEHCIIPASTGQQVISLAPEDNLRDVDVVASVTLPSPIRAAIVGVVAIAQESHHLINFRRREGHANTVGCVMVPPVMVVVNVQLRINLEFVIPTIDLHRHLVTFIRTDDVHDSIHETDTGHDAGGRFRVRSQSARVDHCRRDGEDASGCVVVRGFEGVIGLINSGFRRSSPVTPVDQHRMTSQTDVRKRPRHRNRLVVGFCGQRIGVTFERVQHGGRIQNRDDDLITVCIARVVSDRISHGV